VPPLNAWRFLFGRPPATAHPPVLISGSVTGGEIPASGRQSPQGVGMRPDRPWFPIYFPDKIAFAQRQTWLGPPGARKCRWPFQGISGKKKKNKK